jgi:EpsI family protein
MATRFALTGKSLLIAGTLVVSAAAARLLTPTLHAIENAPQLEQSLPKVIDAWHFVPSPFVQVGLTTGGAAETSMDQPYDQSILRSYRDNHGNLINVAVAWGERQRQEIKIHRPELCYPAQGFQVIKLENTTFPLNTPAGEPVTGKRMLTKDRNGQIEAVSYWIRIGGVYSDSAWKTRMHILQEGLAGRIPDGVLVRVSQRIPDGTNLEAVYQRQEAFAARLATLTDAGSRALLVR